VIGHIADSAIVAANGLICKAMEEQLDKYGQSCSVENLPLSRRQGCDGSTGQPEATSAQTGAWSPIGATMPSGWGTA